MNEINPKMPIDNGLIESSSMDDEGVIASPERKVARSSNLSKNHHNMDKKEILYQFYQLYSVFLEEYGSDTAVIVAVFAAKQQYRDRLKRAEEDNWFYYEHPKLKKKTHITIYRQKIAMKKMVDLGILQIAPQKKGIPPKIFYRIDINSYYKCIEALSKKNK